MTITGNSDTINKAFTMICRKFEEVKPLHLLGAYWYDITKKASLFRICNSFPIAYPNLQSLSDWLCLSLSAAHLLAKADQRLKKSERYDKRKERNDWHWPQLTDLNNFRQPEPQYKWLAKCYPIPLKGPWPFPDPPMPSYNAWGRYARLCWK